MLNAHRKAARSGAALPYLALGVLALAGCSGSGSGELAVVVEGKVQDGSAQPPRDVQAQIAFFEEDGVTPINVKAGNNVVDSRQNGSFRARLPGRLEGGTVQMVVATSGNPGGTREPAEITVILPAAVDAHVDDTAPDTNFGSADTLLAETTTVPAVERWTLVRFDLTGLDGTLLEARLQLFSGRNSTDGGNLHRVADTTWGETAITWNTRPALTTLLGPVGPVPLDDHASLDVTATVATAIAALDDRITLAIADATDRVELLSREGAIARGRPDLIPRLLLIFEGPGNPGAGGLQSASVAVQVDGVSREVILSDTTITGVAIGDGGQPAAGVDVLLERSDGAGGWALPVIPGANPSVADALGGYYFPLAAMDSGDYRLTFGATAADYTELRTPSFPVVAGGKNLQSLVVLEFLGGGGGGGGSGISYASHVQPIFDRNCSCHLTASGPPQGESLLAGVSYNSIVNVPSTEVPTFDRIEPGEPDNSYLIIKVDDGSPNAGLRAGERMPRGLPPLSAEDIATLRQWVTDGAPNN